MLALTLNTNEVKGSDGAEIEFQHRQTVGRSTEYTKIGMSPAAPHVLAVKHSETGQGFSRRRRSATRVDLTIESDVDQSQQVVVSGVLWLDIPVGAITTLDAPKTVLANIISFVASDGTNTTIKYDGTGTGAKALLDGAL